MRAKRPLPPALAKNAARLGERALERLAAQARADIAFIRERKRTITAAFYDIGEALVRLKKKGVPLALGHASYDAMCEAELGLRPTQVGVLVDIVTRLTREEAIAMGQTKAAAFSRLAEATPAADTAASIYRRGVRTPSGAAIGKQSTTREIDRAAKEFRQAARGATGRGRGRTTTAEERAVAHAMEAVLHRHGLKSAKVTAVASVPGKEANLRIEGIPMSRRGVLRDLAKGP